MQSEFTAAPAVTAISPSCACPPVRRAAVGMILRTCSRTRTRICSLISARQDTEFPANDLSLGKLKGDTVTVHNFRSITLKSIVTVIYSHAWTSRLLASCTPGAELNGSELPRLLARMTSRLSLVRCQVRLW